MVHEHAGADWITKERRAYLEDLPGPQPNWPPDVRAVYAELRAHLFDMGVRIRDVRARCGIGNHNISSRFYHFVGRRPKEFLLYHRMELAKQLLQHDHLNISQIAFAVGYESLNSFSQTFNQRTGCSPSAFRRQADET